MTNGKIPRRGPIPALAGITLAVAGNLLLAHLFPIRLGIPLFMDSVMTVAITLYSGLAGGLVTALLYNVIASFAVYGAPLQTLFFLCSCATVILVHCYSNRIRKGWIAVDLLVLSLLVCFANSILGGIISTFAFQGHEHFPSDYVMAGLLMQDIPLIGAAILSRMPINLIDKGIAVFAGYGIALLANGMSESRNRAGK